jgi:hypothetical protein
MFLDTTITTLTCAIRFGYAVQIKAAKNEKEED